MLVAAYLALSLLAGAVVVQRWFPTLPAEVRLVASFGVGVVLTGWVAFAGGFLAHAVGRSDATYYGALGALGVNAVIVALGRATLRPAEFRIPRRATLGAAAAVVVSALIMRARLSGSPLKVSLNTWGDTALHIGIARSFSQGDNYPPVLPIFSGQPIRYHFGFDFYAGTLDRLGMPIGLAFNIPAALGFAGIMVLLVSYARLLWGRTAVGVVAAVLFATNSSLAFLRYFDDYPSVFAALRPAQWWHHAKYEAIGPYDGDRISIFWTLNPYLTQTHLIIAIVIVLTVGYVLLWHVRGPAALPRPRAAVAEGAAVATVVVPAGQVAEVAEVGRVAVGAGGEFAVVAVAGRVAVAEVAGAAESVAIAEQITVEHVPVIEDVPVAEVAAVPPPRGLPRDRAVVLGLLAGGSFWINGIVFLVAMLFFCAALYACGERRRADVRPDLAVAAATIALFAYGSQVGSDAIRLAALALAVGGLIVLGPVRDSLPFLLAAGIVAFPQMVWLNGGPGTNDSLNFHSGYLVDHFSFHRLRSYADLVSYWWLNLGLVLPLVVLAAVLAGRADRRLLGAVMSIFLFGNVVAFGHELGGNNHKTFNLWEVLVNLFAAYALVRVAEALWRGTPGAGRQARNPRVLVGRAVALVVVPIVGIGLVLSGLLDFMTLKNDPRYEVLGDRTRAVEWIRDQTPRDAVFLTDYGEVYTVPTLAGRAVYLGGFSAWPATMGYDDAPRQDRIARIYAAPDKGAACEGLRAARADYVQVGDTERGSKHFGLDRELFDHEFVSVYADEHLTYYDVRATCGGGSS